MSALLEGLKAAGSVAGKILLEGAKLGAEIGYQGTKAAGKGTKEIVKGTAKGAVEGAKAAGKILTGG